MTVTIDREKWLAAIANEPDGPCTATLPFFTFTLRGQLEDPPRKLPAMVAVLIGYIDRLDRSLGGDGVVFDPSGTVEGPNRLTVRVVALSGGGAIRRFAAIETELTELQAQAHEQVIGSQAADFNAKIEAELASPYPLGLREAVKHLEPLRA
jgi:hypothetical protein